MSIRDVNRGLATVRVPLWSTGTTALLVTAGFHNELTHQQSSDSAGGGATLEDGHGRSATTPSDIQHGMEGHQLRLCQGISDDLRWSCLTRCWRYCLKAGPGITDRFIQPTFSGFSVCVTLGLRLCDRAVRWMILIRRGELAYVVLVEGDKDVADVLRKPCGYKGIAASWCGQKPRPSAFPG